MNRDLNGKSSLLVFFEAVILYLTSKQNKHWTWCCVRIVKILLSCCLYPPKCVNWYLQLREGCKTQMEILSVAVEILLRLFALEEMIFNVHVILWIGLELKDEITTSQYFLFMLLQPWAGGQLNHIPGIELIFCTNLPFSFPGCTQRNACAWKTQVFQRVTIADFSPYNTYRLEYFCFGAVKWDVQKVFKRHYANDNKDHFIQVSIYLAERRHSINWGD